MIKFTSSLKLFVLMIWTIIIVVIAFFAMIVTFSSKGAVWIAQKLWTPFILYVLGAKLKVKGLENIEKGKSYLILANHTSNLDIPMLTAGLPLLLYYVAKKEMKKIPFLGWIMTAVGMVFIDRTNKEKAIRSMRMAGNQIKKGKNIVIFPEGTFNGSIEMLPFKKGAFHLAMHANIEILPIAIVNAQKVWPEYSSLALQSGEVELRIGKPILTDNLTIDDIESMSNHTRQVIQSLLDEV